eukprot:5685904-Amphidinium_carterae.1
MTWASFESCQRFATSSLDLRCDFSSTIMSHCGRKLGSCLLRIELRRLSLKRWRLKSKKRNLAKSRMMQRMSGPKMSPA